MSFNRCSSPESFFVSLGGVGCHGIVSAFDVTDSWLAGGKELDEKSRFTVRSPDMGCFEVTVFDMPSVGYMREAPLTGEKGIVAECALWSGWAKATSRPP